MPLAETWLLVSVEIVVPGSNVKTEITVIAYDQIVVLFNKTYAFSGFLTCFENPTGVSIFATWNTFSGYFSVTSYIGLEFD